MHQDYSEEDFDPDDQLRGKDVGVRSPTQDVCERISQCILHIHNLKLTTMCICMCPMLKLILGVTCGVSTESEEEEGGGSESVSLQEDNSTPVIVVKMKKCTYSTFTQKPL